MFTGIIEEIGTIQSIQRGAGFASLSIQAQKVLQDLQTGDSIAVNGVCLTVTHFTRNAFCADVMHETLNRSALGALRAGSHVNLERSMPANGRFGGHIVSGHIDGTGCISDIRKDGNAMWYTVTADAPLLRGIIPKGSIAIDGISLTVAKLETDCFSVSIIPHTAGATTLASRRMGDMVNLETDCIGKYIERLLGGTPSGNQITAAFLSKHGF